MSHRPTRLAAAAVSLCALAALGLGTPAFAEDTAPSGGPTAANVALINPTAKTNLHITKYAGGELGGNDNGLPKGALSGVTPLAGVTFKVYPVAGVDLTTNAGWAAASAYYNNIPLAEANRGALAGTCTTTSTGACELSNLPVGLYYVSETSAPTGTTMSAPFVVTLPMTNPTSLDAWLYDVYVYPKNQQDTISKTVADKGTQTTDNSSGPLADHTIDYTITTSITDGIQPIGMYVIYDDLDPSLSFAGATITLGDSTLAAGTDYKVSTAAAWGGAGTVYTSGAVAGGPVVAVVFTDGGMTKLAADRSLTVKTVLHTSVNAEDADGIVPNQASFIPNERWWMQHQIGRANPLYPEVYPPFKVGLPSDEVVTKFGDVQITKVDAEHATTVLPGAEFTVYADANGDGTCAPAEMVAGNVLGGPVVTDAAGVARYKGLQTSDFYDNAVQTQLITYCVVETKAPVGYNLNAQPIAFTILQGDGTALALTNLTVQNEETHLKNRLPLTGGDGVAAFSLGGLGLIGVGVAYFVIAARRRRNAA